MWFTAESVVDWVFQTNDKHERCGQDVGQSACRELWCSVKATVSNIGVCHFQLIANGKIPLYCQRHRRAAMGRTRPKKQSIIKPTEPVQPTPSKKRPSISSLLEKAQTLIVQCDYELALKFVRRILEQQPGNVEAKEMLGVALLETGDLEGAKQVCKALQRENL